MQDPHSAGIGLNMNPKGGTPPVEHRFRAGEESSNRNAGGRTPTAWLRKMLNRAARDISDDGRTYRDHLGMTLIYRGMRRGETGLPDTTITAKDANIAASLVFAYDMGKPIESLEVTSNTGPKVMFYLPAKGGKDPAEMPAPPPMEREDDDSGDQS